MAANRGVVSISNESVVTCDRVSEFSVLLLWADVIEIFSSFMLPLASTESVALVFCCASTVSPPPLREFQMPLDDSLRVTFFSVLAELLSLLSLPFFRVQENHLTSVLSFVCRCLAGSGHPSLLPP